MYLPLIMKNTKVLWVMLVGAAAVTAYAFFGMPQNASTPTAQQAIGTEATAVPAATNEKAGKEHKEGCCPAPAETESASINRT